MVLCDMFGVKIYSEYVESFWGSVILGAKRSSNAALLRLDEPFWAMFGWEKGMSDQSTLYCVFINSTLSR